MIITEKKLRRMHSTQILELLKDKPENVEKLTKPQLIKLFKAQHEELKPENWIFLNAAAKLFDYKSYDQLQSLSEKESMNQDMHKFIMSECLRFLTLVEMEYILSNKQN